MNNQRQISDFTDLFLRSRAVYPIHQDRVTLKKRHESGDKNVIAYLGGSGHVDFYNLEFTQEQRDELEQEFIKAAGTKILDENIPSVFIATLERWAESILDHQAIAPPSQKTRQRAIESFAKAVEKADTALSELDSAALGWLFASVVDKLVQQSVKASTDKSETVSIKNRMYQTMVEAGEFRSDFRKLASVIVEAATEARENLPQSDRIENDPRLNIAKGLELHFIQNGLEFSTSENGFPAKCLRAVFDLGGLEVEKVSYWLKKAAEHPDSYANFQQRMQKN